MALLQILDPTDRPRPIGIDLGTTHSLVAWVTPTGSPVAIFDCDSDPLVPSVVHYAKGRPAVVGKPALAKLVDYPSETIVSAKRLMGRGSDDPALEELSAYRFAEEKSPVVRFQLEDRIVTPVEVSAEILRELRTVAVDAIGSVGGAVITVPAYFDDAQRQATKDAASLAGIEPVRLLNEPTAAALAYGLDEKQDGTFVVYDLGGGTFDVTVLRLDDGVFQVLATGGDSQLGGDDMDRAVFSMLLTQFEKAQEDLTPSQTQAALMAARSIKHGLSDAEEVAAEVELPGLAQKEIHLSRSEFGAAIAPLVARTEKAVRRALRDAELAESDVDGVILVGGATRTPAVRDAVAELFGREPLVGVDPDQVVALGAAQQADMLFGEGPREDVLLLDVLPLSLGV